jgi:unsaturated rhamnogalacturonyl hydrolase
VLGVRQWLVAALLGLCSAPLAAVRPVDVGLSTRLALIEGEFVPAGAAHAPTVLLVGGLGGDDESARAVRDAVRAYDAARRRDRAVNLWAIPLVNPDAAPLVFPPTGAAYREQAEAHVLWRWIGTHAPDLVLVAGRDSAGLGAALASAAPALVGRVPSRAWTGEALATLDASALAPSAAHREIDRRLARSPRQVAEALAARYGHSFDAPTYINAIALIGQLKLGHTDAVRALVEPYVSGAKDSLARANSLTMAGHIVFTELARATDDPRYAAMVRKVADLGFDERGAMRESMPYHNEFSDSMFMGAVPAAEAGALTGQRRYFDLAVRHLKFMQRLDLRPDGLYRHQPATDAAWGRGNAFAAFGLAFTLGELPREHSGYGDVLGSYRALMAALLDAQTPDGLWRNVVDVRGAYEEYSATAMIGLAMQRGLANGWLAEPARYRAAVARAWRAVNARTGDDGTVIDVCESTARIESLEGYLHREAILGADDRAGAMALWFATELMR